MAPDVEVEVNGVFNRRVVRKTLTVRLPEDGATETLLRIIGNELGLSGDLLQGDPVVLLNGRRLEPREDVRLSDDDTLSVLSPLAGG